jgi:hypothetical protein
MLQFLIAILVLMLGVDIILLSQMSVSQISDLEQLVVGTQFVDPVYSQGWPTYDAGDWTIKYPSSLTPKRKNGNLVAFEGFQDASTLTIHTSNISDDPLGEMILQRDPHRVEVLGTILQLQKEALQGFSNQNLITARKVVINNSDAAEFIEVDASNPSDITFSAQTTFVHADTIASLELFTSHSPKPDAGTEQIYNAMLKTFRVK